MSELLQFIVVIAFGALCFGGGYLMAFIITRNHWGDEMIKRGVARYNWKTGIWEWESRQLRSIEGANRRQCDLTYSPRRNEPVASLFSERTRLVKT